MARPSITYSDLNVGPRDHIFFDFRHNTRTQVKNNYFGNNTTGTTLLRANDGATVDNVFRSERWAARSYLLRLPPQYPYASKEQLLRQQYDGHDAAARKRWRDRR